jgi:hypothetical protein
MASVLPPCASSDSWSALTRSVRGRASEQGSEGGRAGGSERGSEKEKDARAEQSREVTEWERGRKERERRERETASECV